MVSLLLVLAGLALPLTSALSLPLPSALPSPPVEPPGPSVPLTPPPRPFFNRELCQYPTANPLLGCPTGTLLVGRGQKFTTIQSAVASIPNDTTPATILILPGTYVEQVNITRSASLYLLGQTRNARSQAANNVTVLWRAIPVNGSDNAGTATLTVAPNLDAALTGAGPSGHAVPVDNPFGNTDFRTYNIDFVNDYAPYAAAQSLAISTGYANTGFYYSGFYSYQDTVYIGKLGSAYFKHCAIAGQTDFLYGFGTAWIQSSELQLRGCGGGITAWKGTNTTFPNSYGVYIQDSNVGAANSSLNIVGKCALGRPWNNQMRSLFANNYLDSSIVPGGYIPWSANADFSHVVTNQTMMMEYHDYGPGMNATAREAAFPVTKEITTEMYRLYDDPEKVFQFRDGSYGNVAWIDRML